MDKSGKSISSERASAIKSMGILLEHRQQQQKHMLSGKINCDTRNKFNVQIKNQSDDDDENHDSVAWPRSILKGTDNNTKTTIKDLNNNDVLPFLEKSDSNKNDHEHSVGKTSGAKKGLRWKTDVESEESNKQQMRFYDLKIDDHESLQTFSCKVCGGRIWPGERNQSAIFGERYDDELLVHWTCYRCATCGLDLGSELEERVFKRGNRFYCYVHGPTAFAASMPSKNNIMKNERSNIAEITKCTESLPQNVEDVNKNKCKTTAWWEKNTEEFNGNKKSSTTIRYYGEGGKRNTDDTGNHDAQIRINAAMAANKLINKNNNRGGNGITTINDQHNKKNYNKMNTNDMNHGNGGEYHNENVRFVEKTKASKPYVYKPFSATMKKENNNVNNYSMNMANETITNNNDNKEQQQNDRCEHCGIKLTGSFVLAKNRVWCPEHFCCANSACARSLLQNGFVEEAHTKRIYCPKCYEILIAPTCNKCSLPLVGTCLNALGHKWHPECFVCAHCCKEFGTQSFFVENGKPYCEDDWNALFTTKCAECCEPIKVGQKWLEALGGKSFHVGCFKCNICYISLEGQTFFEREQRPYCRAHAFPAITKR